ncbi:MAG: Guanylate kinase [candidate division WS2 bacterium]|nr:Guanylate kinase [Candidatus Lithacetigena glycinireducens]
MILKKNIPLLVVISGPSGSGKTTIVREILSKSKNIVFSISYTTRERREKEINKKDYFFINEEKFKNMIKEKKFLEYAKVHNHFYGTARELVLRELKKNKDVLLDIDVKGALQVKKASRLLKIKSVFIFVVPPSKKELKKRLTSRSTDICEEVIKRLKNAEEELRYVNNYDYLVVNDNLFSAVEKISSIIKVEKYKIKKEEIAWN